MKLEPFLLEILVCPQCRAALTEGGSEEQPELVCTSESCALAYPVRDGIPVLLINEARRPS